MSDPHAEIVVADALAENLKKLAANADAVKKFTGRGGWLMLWGLAPEGLADFNKVVGQNHVLRPFRMERVTLPPVRDPILSGLTIRDVALESTKRIFPWSGDVYPSDDSFTTVVDLDDIAPFCNAGKDSYIWGQITNGLVSADAWVFIYGYNIKDDPHLEMDGSTAEGGGSRRVLDRSEHLRQSADEAQADVPRRCRRRVGDAGAETGERAAGLRAEAAPLHGDHAGAA